MSPSVATRQISPDTSPERSVRAAWPDQLAPADGINTGLRNGVAHWLAWQCRMIVGVTRGAVYLPLETQDRLQMIEVWPGNGTGTPTMLEFAESAWRTGRHVMRKAVDGDGADAEVHDFVALPVQRDDQVLGIVTLVLQIRSDSQRKAVVQLIDWGAEWLQRTLLGLHGDRREAANVVLAGITLVSSDLPLPLAVHRLCNLLADSLGAARVACGLVDGVQLDVVGLSGQVQFDRRLDHVDRLRAAMEECVDQGQSLLLPAPSRGKTGLTRAHARVLEQPGIAAVCSAPITVDDVPVGALLLVRDDGIDPILAAQLADVAQQVAPVLAMKRREARSPWRRLTAGLRQTGARLFGAGHWAAKLSLALVLLAVVTLTAVHTERRVAADSRIEGTVQRAIVAPVEGYLLESTPRAGDHVSAGQVLARIDDRELQLERRKWESERDKHNKAYREALANRDRAEISLSRARVAQAEAELELLDELKARTVLRAPFGGTLISGDLTRSLGAPLERGQVLFEIVPEDSYRAVLLVEDRDMRGIEPGQVGELRLTGMPESAIGFEVERIVPLATADTSGNRFRVEARLVDPPAGLRPGMQGVAKVTTGRVSLMRAWTDDFVDRLRFRAWSLGL